jgi:hypothetical protein
MKLLKHSTVILFIIGLTLSSVISASAAKPNVDVLFKTTFDSVQKVVALASENGVKPYYFKSEGSLEPGTSESQSVAAAAEKGMQKQIYEARGLVNQLPEELLNYKRTFSSILDNYQHPIYERIVYLIGINQEVPKQSDINMARVLIKDVPDSFKASYSSELDRLQGNLFNKASQLVDKAASSKSPADIAKAKEAVLELKTIASEFSSPDISNFINYIDGKINTIDSENALTVIGVS